MKEKEFRVEISVLFYGKKYGSWKKYKDFNNYENLPIVAERLGKLIVEEIRKWK